MIRKFFDKHGETLLGLAVTIVLGAFALWLLPPLDIPYRKIAAGLALLALAYAAVWAGDRLKKLTFAPARWLGLALLAGGAVIILLFALAFICLIIWAKFTSPPLACPQCD